MSYSVSCECGRTHAVTAGAAGTDLTCGCGRAVAVPSLHKLRLGAGEAVLGPELLIEAAVRSGELPTTPGCAGCAGTTDRVVFVWAVCERARERKLGWPARVFMFVFFWVFFGWLVLVYLLLTRPREVRMLGHDRTYRLPLRLCDDCARLRGRHLLAAVAQEPMYASLLAKYPDAEVSLAGK